MHDLDTTSIRVLITGASGLLGRALLETAPAQHQLIGTWHTHPLPQKQPEITNPFAKTQPPLLGHCQDYCSVQLDVLNISAVVQLIKDRQPDIIIHCAADGRVDAAETGLSSYYVNVEGTRNVVDVAKLYNAKVIYISSNAVFDGDDPNYDEFNVRYPVNRYGTLKVHAEDVVMSSPRWVIIRPFLLYGWPGPGGRSNWANTIIEQLNCISDQPIPLVDDVIWMPTYVRDCAQAIWKLIHLENDIVHVAGPDRMTLYEFGCSVADVFGFGDTEKRRLERAESRQFRNMAPRPRDTTYTLGKLHRLLGAPLSGVREGLAKMREDHSL